MGQPHSSSALNTMGGCHLPRSRGRSRFRAFLHPYPKERFYSPLRSTIGGEDKGSLREVAKRREGSELHAGGVLEPERDRAAARRWREATEGECVTMKLRKCNFLCNAGSFHRKRSPADCQASATPKNASKGESQPKHFLGLRLIDKTIFCKVSLSKE